MESKIIENLQNEFVKNSHYFSNAIDFCAELDCLMAYAMIALEFDYVKPNLCFDPIDERGNMTRSFIWAREARHPLFEIIMQDLIFVPNDIHTGAVPDERGRALDSEKIKVITSPNASGKTVYLRQVGLLVYMAMIGSYVPATEATIGDFDRIFTRINSNESISLRMSTFSIDIQQMSDALNGSTYKSLILVDEFGKGTQACDGQALLAAIIRHWLNEPVENLPHVFIATHFYEMFQDAMAARLFSQNHSRIQYLTFDCLHNNQEEPDIQDINNNSTSKLTFLYQLKPGLTESSYAINIAQSVGLPDEVISRAIELFNLIKKPSLSVENHSKIMQTPESIFSLTK